MGYDKGNGGEYRYSQFWGGQVMQFKVPQNIDMEDKIIGPLTLTQFFYLLFGGLVIYILFTKLAAWSAFLFWILALPIGVFCFAMAFLKVQDQPFPHFLVAGLKFLTQPKKRIWQHYEPATAPRPTPKAKSAAPTQPKKNLDTVRVRELAGILDKPGEDS